MVGHIADDVDHIRVRVGWPDHLGSKLDVHALPLGRAEGRLVQLRGPETSESVVQVPVGESQAVGRDEFHERMAHDVAAFAT